MTTTKNSVVPLASNPAPIIPSRTNDDEIDVKALNGADLEFLIKGNHIQKHDGIYPFWRGADRDGEPFDRYDAVTTVPDDYDPLEGMRLTLRNDLVEPFEGGWASLSYKVNSADESTPDSRRVFCYLGMRDRVEPLPVAQARESHDLTLVFNEIPGEGLLLLVPRYQAIQAGDKATLVMRRFTSAGEERDPITAEYHVTRANLQQLPQWQLAKSSFVPIRGGRVAIHYEVTLVGHSAPLLSPVQTFVVGDASPVDLLRPVDIVGYTGTPLDPGNFPDGLTVRIRAYDALKPGDHVLLHWSSPAHLTPVVLVARMDVSSEVAGEVVFHVPADLLVQGIHNVFYQFARSGRALRSQSLSVEFDIPRELSAPIIEKDKEDDQRVGGRLLDAGDAILGAYVVVPDIAKPGETFEVHWQGYGTYGQQIVSTPVETNGRRFKIDPSVVAANMHQPLDANGRRIKVFYYMVAADGTRSAPSAAVDLRVAPIKLNNTVFCREADGNGNLDQSKLVANGALLRVTGAGLWSFAAIGQLFTIEVQAVAVLREAKPITAAELNSATVEQWLSRAVYGQMEHNKQHTVSGRVSFDAGDSWHKLNDAGLIPRKDR